MNGRTDGFSAGVDSCCAHKCSRKAQHRLPLKIISVDRSIDSVVVWRVHGRTHGRYFSNARLRLMQRSFAMFEVVDIDGINRKHSHRGFGFEEGLEEGRTGRTSGHTDGFLL